MSRDQRTTTWQKIKGWFRLRKLVREIRSSESFQRECEKMHCFHLAELEGKHRAELQEKIRELEPSALVNDQKSEN